MLYDSRDRQVSAGGSEHTIWMDGVIGKFFPSQIIFFILLLSQNLPFDLIFQIHVLSTSSKGDERTEEVIRINQTSTESQKKSVLELQCASDDSDGVPVLHHLLQCPGGFSDNFVLIICIKIVT